MIRERRRELTAVLLAAGLVSCTASPEREGGFAARAEAAVQSEVVIEGLRVATATDAINNPVAELVISAWHGATAERGVAITDDDFARLHEPAEPHREQATGIRKSAEHPKNLIIVLAEGIPYNYTSIKRVREDPTPNLMRLASEDGVLFDRFYANWHSSIQSIFATVCGSMSSSMSHRPSRPIGVERVRRASSLVRPERCLGEMKPVHR